MRAYDYVTGQPWAITPEYLQLIVEITSQERSVEEIARGIALADERREEREQSPAAVAAKLGTRIDKTRHAAMREGGIAILPIEGPIFRRANLFTAYSGATSTAMLSTDFNALIENPDVQAILLSIDSPGGEAFGIGELASMIGASNKLVVSYISGMGASAAYWLASAAQEIVADSTAILGSIGVVLTARDTRRAEKQRGIDSYEIVSTQSPRKRLEPSSEEGKAALQETADAMADVFIESIARNRGVSVETVLSEFGKGGVMVGRRAVEAGLADRIGSFEVMLSEMASGMKRKKRAPVTAINSKPNAGANSGGKRMSFKSKLAAWLNEQPDEQEAGATQTLVIKTEQGGGGQPAKAEESEEVKQLRARNAVLLKEKLTAEATSFIEAKILACEVLPAVKEGFIKSYVQAGLDDDANPLAEGETRTATLKAQYEGRPAHSLTRETTKAGLPAGAGAVADSEDPDAKAIEEDAASAKAYAERANGKKAS